MCKWIALASPQIEAAETKTKQMNLHVQKKKKKQTVFLFYLLEKHIRDVIWHRVVMKQLKDIMDSYKICGIVLYKRETKPKKKKKYEKMSVNYWDVEPATTTTTEAKKKSPKNKQIIMMIGKRTVSPYTRTPVLHTHISFTKLLSVFIFFHFILLFLWKTENSFYDNVIIFTFVSWLCSFQVYFSVAKCRTAQKMQ